MHSYTELKLYIFTKNAVIKRKKGQYIDKIDIRCYDAVIK